MSQTDVIQNALAKVSDADVRKIHEVVKRASAFARKHLGHFDAVSCELDVTVVHATVGLKLDQMLSADDFNFMHDVRPRFAKPQEQAA